MNGIRERLFQFLRSRFFLPYVLLILVGVVMIWRIFSLQIVHGDEYLDHFTLSIEKDIDIPGTRGNIYDRNGELLAYNELAYSVTITDTIESGSSKNEQLNGIILRMVRIIEGNGDDVILDFGVYLDEDGNFCFTYDGTQHLRFLADIYGRQTVSDLLYVEREANPEEVMRYLASSEKYGIGSYAHDETGGRVSFFPLMGYTDEEILKIAVIRYRLGLNSFQKYIATTVATDVSDRTVAQIMENSESLQGVSIAQDAIRRYNHAVYFSQIIGYTGRISQSEYELYSAQDPDYGTNDYVGKTGIEYSMESTLKGTKGQETVFVDNLGRIISSQNVTLPTAGSDIYLTIDADLQMAAYRLLEQKIAGIVVAKLTNEKTASGNGRNRAIPVYDVYSALFENNVIDMAHLSKPYAGETEQAVYEAFTQKRESVFDALREEMLHSKTPYKELGSEMQEYESFIVSMLGGANYGVIRTEEVDTTDATYLAWRVQETISLYDYLRYCISMQWIDMGKLTLDAQYADADEIYAALVDYVIEKLASNSTFSKKLYKYMLLGDVITGKQLCLILWEQDVIQVEPDRMNQLRSGQLTSYGFMRYLITNLYITPAQLGLEPCSGSIVITDPGTGEVLALVSYPGYDNNRLANTADAAYLARLTSDRSNPLWNYATQQRTAPGSTFKMVSSVAGVEEGVIDIGTQIECNGTFTKLTGTVHNCWIFPGRHGQLALSGGIANSCNCFFYEVGYRLANDGAGYNDHTGVERIARYAELFGLGDLSGVEIAESEPKISDQYPVPSAIGQGTHNFTTTGLARYVSTVANGGTVYQLSLIHEIKRGDVGSYYYTPSVRNEIDLDESLWNAIHIGMLRVVESKSYFDSLGIAAAGKTGTAQEATNKPNHALFVGYAPYGNPEIAIAVRIANGYSSDFAAQVACDVFKYYFDVVEEGQLLNGRASDATAVSGGD